MMVRVTSLNRYDSVPRAVYVFSDVAIDCEVHTKPELERRERKLVSVAAQNAVIAAVLHKSN